MITLLFHLFRLFPFLCGGHWQLALENLALRQQLAIYKRTAARPKLRRSDRLFWVWLSKAWAGWRTAVIMVTPDTVLRWQRRRFRAHWRRLAGRPTMGRPPVDAQIIALVTRMAAANPLWGAPRIHGELLKLGIDAAERTISRLIRRRPPRPSQIWRTFLTNHVRDLVSIDFVTVPTAGLRVLFVLVVLAHHRRRIVQFNVTEHPTAHWTAQQIVDAFPNDSAPSYLLRDRDQVYGEQFRRRVKGLGIEEAEEIDEQRVLERIESTLSFDSAQRITGQAACNRYFGALELGEGTIRLKPAGTTRMACAPAVMDQESRFLAAQKDLVAASEPGRDDAMTRGDQRSIRLIFEPCRPMPAIRPL